MAAKKTAKKATEPVAKKAAKTAKKAVAKKAAKPSSPATKPAARPSLDAVARAAYLNYRRRVEQGLPGDSHGDWLYAERQLMEGSQSAES